MLVRIQNTFVNAVNKNHSLPKYIIVILEDDLISFMNYSGKGMSELMGNCLTWLDKKFKEGIDKRKSQLPDKAKHPDQPCVYWVLPPLHSGFSITCHKIRTNYSKCLETLLKGRRDMRVIKLKAEWQYTNRSMVFMQKITENGLYAYWHAIDKAFEFNALRHELFLAKILCDKTYRQKSSNEARSEDTKTIEHNVTFREDEVLKFFKKRKQNNRFHWKPTTHNPGNRFLLPRPRQF